MKRTQEERIYPKIVIGTMIPMRSAPNALPVLVPAIYTIYLDSVFCFKIKKICSDAPAIG
jgi:hypothetical protein